jgi:putative ATP-binding cassette transporter
MALLQPSLWSRFLRIALPFFRSSSRKRAVAALLVLVALLLGINGLNVVNSYVGRDFMTALAEKQPYRFHIMAGLWALVFAGSTIVQVFARYAEESLGLVWREWLTCRLLDRYLTGRVYHHLAGREDIDNPDQRISEDVRTFTATTLSFLVLLTNAVLTLLAFAGVLWSITPWLFITAFLYAAGGSLGTILLGRKLVELDNHQLKKEANFRYALGRVREHAGSIAQLGGEGEEKIRLGERLAALVENFRAIILVNRNLGFYITGYNYLVQIIPAAIVAPLYIYGDVPFGTVTQSAMAFTQVLGAFSLIITQFQVVSAYAAVIHRLGAIWEATEPAPHHLPGAEVVLERVSALPDTHPEVSPVPALVKSAEDRIVYNHLTLHTPDDHRLLIENLSLDLSAGKRILLTGPNGAGKTALVLATAGLWDVSEGEVYRPGPDSVMFLPEKPYIPAASLRDAVLYGLPPNIPDQRILATLTQVGLDELVNKVGGFDAEEDWDNTLSVGERHALAFARVLLANPRFAFFDGASRDLDAQHVDRFFGLLAGTSISYLSVGDQPALSRYHDLRLELLGDGRWQLEPIQR